MTGSEWGLHVNGGGAERAVSGSRSCGQPLEVVLRLRQADEPILNDERRPSYPIHPGTNATVEQITLFSRTSWRFPAEARFGR